MTGFEYVLRCAGLCLIYIIGAIAIATGIDRSSR